MAQETELGRDRPADDSRGNGDRALTHVVYGLQAAFVFNGITMLLGVVLNYAKRSDVRGTLYESHFRHQIHTFWIGLGGLVLFVLLAYGMIVSGLGDQVTFAPALGAAEIAILALIPIALTIYLYYRIIRGWLALLDERPAP